MPLIKMVHEITEMALISAPKIKDIGLTVMDGQFCHNNAIWFIGFTFIIFSGL